MWRQKVLDNIDMFVISYPTGVWVVLSMMYCIRRCDFLWNEYQFSDILVITPKYEDSTQAKAILMNELTVLDSFTVKQYSDS